MRRLFLQIYLGFIVVLLVFAAATSAFVWWADDPQTPPLLRAVAERIAAELPPAESPDAELEAALHAQAQAFGLALAVWKPDGTLAASSAREGRVPHRSPYRRSRREHVLDLADGRTLGVHALRGPRHSSPLPGILVLAAAIAVGAWPIARRIARRLERLQIAVEELGAGDLGARVRVEGRDEVADLARAFNEAAERIQVLVSTQRRLLASASHELRSPLARLRMAVELLGRESDPERQAEAASDIAELDALIEDLLTAARLQSGDAHLAHDDVALHELLAEEAGRAGVAVAADDCPLRGDARLLRRLIRNLLENATRHAGGAEVEATLERAGDGARLVVADRGPGVPEHERERIFEPFYRPAGHSEGADGGVGLGLALVREIARHHRGDARCQARDGGGTRFEVDLRGVA